MVPRTGRLIALSVPIKGRLIALSVPIKGRLIALSVPRKRRLIALSDRVLKDRPRLSAWVAGKMATEKLVRRRTAEGAWLARRGRKATVAPLYCEERVRVSSRVEDGQLVAGCRRAPLVSACDVTACRPIRMRALFGRAGLEWWTLPLDSLVVRASQEFSLFEP